MIRDKVYSSRVREFESMLQKHFQTELVCTISNATSGILGSFYALGLINSEIVTTPLTWSGAITPLKILGNKITYAEIEEPTLTLNPHSLEKYITKNTKAVFTSDFLGYPCKLDIVRNICDKYDLLLIHDAASSFGTQYKNEYSGKFAHVTIYSFGRNKPFTTGEGGCLIANSEEIFNNIGRTIFHPERQDIQIGTQNLFHINTSMHPLAVDYGIESFDEQKKRISNHVISVKKTTIPNMVKTPTYTEPNYYKILIHDSTDKEIKKLPFSALSENIGIDNISLMKYGVL